MTSKKEFKENITKTVSDFLVSHGCHDTGNVTIGSIIARKLVNELETKYDIQFVEEEVDGLRTTEKIIDAVLTKVLAVQPEDNLSRRVFEVVAKACRRDADELHFNTDWETLEGRCTIDELVDALERHFHIHLSYQDFIGITTLRQIYDAVVEKFDA